MDKLKILFLTPNFTDYMDQTCWNSWVPELVKRADVKFHGRNWHDFPAQRRNPVPAIIKHFYGDGEPDLIMQYNYTGSYGQWDKIKHIPKVALVQNGKAYLGVVDMVSWINRCFFDLVIFRFWSTDSWKWRVKLQQSNYKVESYVPYDIMEKYIAEVNCPIRSLPHCINPEMFHDYGYEKIYDIFLLATRSHGFYPIRNDIFRITGTRSQFPEMRRLKLFSPPHLPYHEKMSEIYAQKTRMGCVYGTDYAKALNKSKLNITDGSMFNVAVPKYVESMATKCMVIAPLPDNHEELYFVDGENMVHFMEQGNVKKMKDLIIYYLENDTERNKITDNAYKTVMTHHTGEVRVNQLFDMLEEELGI